MSSIDHLPGTDYAMSYSSTWLESMKAELRAVDIQAIGHANCSYLSTGQGAAPTLLALKRHAQSITNLIRFIVVCGENGAIDSSGSHLSKDAEWCFKKNEALDWLRDLETPYENDSLEHNMPLDALVNLFDKEDSPGSPDYYCPIKAKKNAAHARASNSKVSPQTSPWKSHMNVARHANECLEHLDKEFSPTGGLISMITSDQAELAGLRNCLLGQWLLQHHNLVLRLHELEISYAKALDIAENQQAKPWTENHCYIGELPPEYIGIDYYTSIAVVNTNSDILKRIHLKLDEAEESQQELQQIWFQEGASTERMLIADEEITVPGHIQPDHEYKFRGLATCDLKCRFSRIAGRGHIGKIMFQPAIELDESIKGTKNQEETLPPPVQVPSRTRKHAEGGSDIVAYYDQRNQAAKLAEARYVSLKSQTVWQAELLTQQDGELQALRQAVKELKSSMATP